MGGGGSSSSSSTSTTTNATDKRMVVDTGVGVSSENSTVTVNTLDAGIVNKSLDTIAAADASNGQSFDTLLHLAEKLFDAGSGLVQTSSETAMQAVQAAQTAQNDAAGKVDQKTLIIVAAAAVAGAIIFKK